MASLILTVYSGTALAAGCLMDASQSPVVSDLKDLALKFTPTNERPDQVCTGDGKLCIYAKNGTEPCEETKDSNGKPNPPICGNDLLSQKDSDGLINGSMDPPQGQSGQGKILSFKFTFAPGPDGRQILLINPVDKNGNAEKTNYLKIEPDGPMGQRTYKIATYQGSTLKTSFPLEVAAQDNGQPAFPFCPGPISLAHTGSGSIDANGNWYGVHNGDATDDQFAQTNAVAQSYISTNAAGQSTH